MNPNDTHNEGLSLPTPVNPGVGAHEVGPLQPAATSPETAAVPPLPQPALPIPGPSGPQDHAQAVNPSAQQQPVSQPMSTDELEADDADLIEKEWVVRAKAIVDQNRDDPHTQSKQINRVKADYIKKRYNKDIKVSE